MFNLNRILRRMFNLNRIFDAPLPTDHPLGRRSTRGLPDEARLRAWQLTVALAGNIAFAMMSRPSVDDATAEATAEA
jgi:hypothetical protein